MKAKKFYIRVVIVMFFLLTTSGISFSRIMNNGIENIFDGDTTTSMSRISEEYTDFELLVVQCAGYYLESTTVFQDLLNKIENKDVLGTDYEGWLISAEKSKEYIDHAIDTYNLLISKAEKTSYNQDILSLLAQFDYDSYMVKNNLNTVVFSKVKEFLIQGDAVEVLQINFINFTEISKKISILIDQLNQKYISDLSVLLEINEKYSESTLFGSYVARIFNEIE